MNRSRKSATFDYYDGETQKLQLSKDLHPVSIRTDLAGLQIGNEAAVLFFKHGSKLIHQAYLKFEKTGEDADEVLHPKFTLTSTQITVPDIIESDDFVNDILINGDIAWVFFEKKILKWSIGSSKWITDDTDEKKPVWSISNTNNISRIVV